MDAPSPGAEDPELTYLNVALAFGFIVLNVIFSYIFDLGVGVSLLVAGIRCVVQLAIMGVLLQKVFETENPWAVAAIAFWLNFMGTFETVVNKSKKRHLNMFPSVLFSLLASTIPTSIIGVRFSMSVTRFWEPSQYIPVVGMLCGSTINGVVVAVTYILKEMQDNRDRVEMYLAFGASRMEASKPILVDALRIALTPTINQMSVLGIIAIPGMMTGAILGGSSVQRAAKLQMIIMFLISASTALASICSATYAVSIVVDHDHRLRQDRIYSKPLYSFSPSQGVLRVLFNAGNAVTNQVGLFGARLSRAFKGGNRARSGSGGREERAGLLERGLSYEEAPLSR
ncbi:hypothetical protein GYMLUDRAFT_43680 [Collybiopsis luxurians FD-317 M1]|uniref:Uncharacterized protein n=1 Tax=Collybiopsis luxurians FD-317 M1 TaxID=944289 RepID=A0A0D0CWA5_9AGAR|nr:hypothetical protein GYMLUDRAFT_43680 [Collybiopsis luxurians FD-317 M1]